LLNKSIASNILLLTTSSPMFSKILRRHICYPHTIPTYKINSIYVVGKQGRTKGHKTAATKNTYKRTKYHSYTRNSVTEQSANTYITAKQSSRYNTNEE